MKASKKRVNGFQSQCIKLKIVIFSKVKFDSIDNWIPFNTVFQKWPKLDDHQHHATHFHFCPNHHWCNGVRAESTTSANTVSHTVYTVTKDHWSSAKRLNAHMKHLLFERGGGQSFSGCELNRPSVQVSHKKNRCLLHPGWGQTWACMSLINANTQKFHSWHKLPKEPPTSPRRKTFQHSNRKKTTS